MQPQRVSLIIFSSKPGIEQNKYYLHDKRISSTMVYIVYLSALSLRFVSPENF